MNRLCVNRLVIISAMSLFSFLFGSCSKLASVDSPLQNNTSAKADAEELIGSLMPFAKQMLEQHREFFPFAGKMALDGKITHEGAFNGSEHPPSQELINILRQAHQREARAQKLRACAIIYDIRTIPPGHTEKQDAIAAAVDHISGYSAVVVYPYAFDANGQLRVEAPFAIAGANDIFPSAPKTNP